LVRLPTTSFSTSELFILACTFVPKHYITLRLEPYYTQFGPTFLRLTEQIVINPLLLMFLVVIALTRANVQQGVSVRHPVSATVQSPRPAAP
jgi:hypothetical protein